MSDFQGEQAWVDVTEPVTYYLYRLSSEYFAYCQRRQIPPVVTDEDAIVYSRNWHDQDVDDSQWSYAVEGFVFEVSAQPSKESSRREVKRDWLIPVKAES